jgi:hypothetical protein
MKRFISLMRWATLGAALSMTSSAWAQVATGYEYYRPSTLDGEPITGPPEAAVLHAPLDAATAPFYTGRSVAAGPARIGHYPCHRSRR